MINTDFMVKLEESDSFNLNGKDNLEFLISFNKGENLKALRKTASGGEISRFMLAMKKIISSKIDVEAMIFDEIDTGISGIASQMVGDKIREISEKSQVICITHLPQIASKGSSHFLVKKEEKNNKTLTKVQSLNEVERIDEIAKMIGGESVTDYSKKYAQELISNNS